MTRPGWTRPGDGEWRRGWMVEVLFGVCAGLDVSKRDVKVCVRVQGAGSRATSAVVSTWAVSLPRLEELRVRLVAEGVQRVVLESTSDYWRPVFYVLSEQLDVVLVQPAQVKALPGRKSDVSDAEWLADLGAHGLVRASFVPPERQRQLRDLTRSRVGLSQDRARDMQRLEKDLEDACIKLSGVVSDLQGVSARAMLAGLVEGSRDPATLAELARGRMRPKIDQLTEALTGRFNDHHAFLVQFRLDRIDAATADLDRLDARIDALIVADPDFRSARDLLLSVPGLGQHGAEELLAEIGADMSVFASPAQLASWCGVCPGSHESAGKHKKVKTRPGNHYVKRTMGIAAKAAVRRQSGFLATRFKRLTARRGYTRALVATQHTMIITIWHMLSNGEYYRDLGGDYYQRRNPQKVIRSKIADLEAAGYTVTLNQAAA